MSNATRRPAAGFKQSDTRNMLDPPTWSLLTTRCQYRDVMPKPGKMTRQRKTAGIGSTQPDNVLSQHQDTHQPLDNQPDRR
jgi:hypothetical protein